ncbi:2',3'-cyclic-nucleotide 2'-phosphodiesterase (5'-nucleotidase family) [Inquilinus ginsengisoli]|uniref:2',3'-cyclic-nucleotide 2'-phosphodiesterase (5'-nucleotidase family) n=1 Tax=Inquilinus ginsengisoli TaxID=363840 RepID=A0ABU1JXS2_9PROT|nr:5'-nucleotidase C-terminal domain-containing protein [Inquilinus ginsengisoli]MDR6293082.1 2',3'-cyclic-nucleotide 2'-phosphodiesterase (5'-nucleotidase family) [Inquilinus ginsengisoli]
MQGPSRRQVMLATLFAAAPLPGWAAAAPLRLAFLHVNDVYEIGPVRGQGGFGQLATLLKQARAANPHSITTFGGDTLSPSVMSGLTKGSQMIDLFNAVGVDYAVWGNHEFDYGPDLAAQRVGESKFPWLGANVLGKDGKPFGGGIATATRQVGDYTIGFLGILTPDTATLSSPGPDISFPDIIATAKQAVEALKAQGANILVALTHLGFAQDRQLAQSVKGLHLVLGGHDHDPIMFYENNVLVFKAGYDSHYLGVVELEISTRDTKDGPIIAVLPSWEVRPTAGVEPDAEIQAKVDSYNKALDDALGVVIGKTAVELDSQRGSVRTRETTMGDLIADGVRWGTPGAQIAIINGGGVRGDRLIAAGTELTRKDILAELPFGNVAVLLELKGADIRAALESGVSQVEAVAGRFPQVSGLAFTWDPAKPPGSRIVSVTVDGKPLDDAATYRVATNDYMAGGGDGYAAMTRGKMLVDASAGRLMATVVMDYVTSVGTVAPKVDGRITRV